MGLDRVSKAMFGRLPKIQYGVMILNEKGRATAGPAFDYF